jgi:hypothetical protein
LLTSKIKTTLQRISIYLTCVCFYLNISVDHNNFIPLINNWETEIVDKTS